MNLASFSSISKKSLRGNAASGILGKRKAINQLSRWNL
jgi:hypothetical protein